MLPIQKSQFIAQCRAYIRLNDELTRMIQDFIPEQSDQNEHYDQQTREFNSFRQRYLNQRIRTVHSSSVQEQNEQGGAMCSTNSNEIVRIEEPQVCMSSMIPMPVQYLYAEPLAIPASSDSPETLSSLDIQVALEEGRAQQAVQPEPIPTSMDAISELLKVPNSPLLEDNMMGDWNLENLFDHVSDTDSNESLVIDTDYESEKETDK